MTDALDLMDAFHAMSAFETQTNDEDFSESDWEKAMEDIGDDHGFEGYIVRLLWLEWKNRPKLEQQQENQWLKQYKDKLAVSF